MSSTNGQRLADVAAATSMLGWFASWAANALPAFQVLACIVGIISGCFAIAYHWKRLK
jgi:F0F1-type ATP synthase assembly protein I